jgi:hypothetical protein
MAENDDYPPGIAETERRALDRRIVEELREHGYVRPPWQFMDEHPYSIGWRMGGGESHLLMFSAWWSRLAPDEPSRVAWVRRWAPTPTWLPWAARLIWPELDEEEDEPAVERLEAAGLGSVAAWQAGEQRAAELLEAELASREGESEDS